MNERGIDYQSMGFLLFNNLIELDVIPAAIHILEQLLIRGGSDRVDKFFTPWAFKNRRVNLSGSAKESIYKTLSAKSPFSLNLDTKPLPVRTTAPKFSSAELILALLCFSKDLKSTGYYAFLEEVEREVLPSVEKLPLGEVCSLLHCYASAGRLFPPMIAEIDKVLTARGDQLNMARVKVVLWSVARLNHRDGLYLTSFAERFFKEVANSDQLTLKGVVEDCI
jgi:hypothetical protein